jgi:hypothetical protein
MRAWSAPISPAEGRGPTRGHHRRLHATSICVTPDGCGWSDGEYATWLADLLASQLLTSLRTLG